MEGGTLVGQLACIVTSAEGTEVLSSLGGIIGVELELDLANGLTILSDVEEHNRVGLV